MEKHMEGILSKNMYNEWVVVYFQPTLEGPLFWSFPLLQESFDINSRMNPVIQLKEGLEVQFEIVDYPQKCKECKEKVEYAKLIKHDRS